MSFLLNPGFKLSFPLRAHVGRCINLIWKLWYVYLKSALYLVEYLLVRLAGNERDGKALGAETASAANTVQELVRVVREVVIDDNIDTLNVDTTSKQVCGNEDASIELLERFVLCDAFLLLLSGMNADRRKVALGQQTVQFVSTGDLADEDDNLIKLKGIKQVVELSVLLGLGKLYVVKLQSMESQLSIIVDVDLHRVLAKLLAYRADFLAESGTEHHHLFLVWGHAKDLLHVTAHVKGLKHAIALVQYEMLDVIQLEGLLPGQSEDTPAGTSQGALVRITYIFDEGVVLTGCQQQCEGSRSSKHRGSS